MNIDPRLHRIVAAQPYPLLFATISGAHLYGFPSPDSDFDLRGVHVLPLEKVIGLEVKDETIQQMMIVPGDEESEGRARHSVRAEQGQNLAARTECTPYPKGSLEMDIVTHDVRKFFGLLLKKNGYVLEQLFSPLIVHTTPEHEELKEICRARILKMEKATKNTSSPRPSPPQVCGREGDSAGGAGFSGVITKHTTPEHEELKEICRAKIAAEKNSSLSTSSDELRSKRKPPLPQPSPLPRPRDGGEGDGAGLTGVITRHHSHHYFGFAETQWELFLKESPRRVKPLLYVYRVLLTGIHLMRTGVIEANLLTLNEEFRLPYVGELVARKLAGPEKSKLEDADMAFHEAEYQRLRGELQAAHDASPLPESPGEETRAALNDLLVRIRMKAIVN